MIKNLLATAVLIIGTFVSTITMAQNTVTIQVGPASTNTYTPAIVGCTVGDTIKFVWVSGSHPTQSADGTTIPLVTLDGSAGLGSTYKIVMNTPGTVNYFCTAHSGMTGVIYVKSTPNLTPTNELFFSEYIEGSSNNKALEIYNPSSLPINMSGYSVRLFANGTSIAGNTLYLPNRNLAPGDVYVIANSAANVSILAVDDTTSNVTFYNGDDAIGLFSGSTQIDVIGTIGTDPGTFWAVGSGTTLDYTLIRKPNVYVGTTNWTIGATQWDVLPKDTIRLNSHTVTSLAPTLSFNPTSVSINENAGTATVSVAMFNTSVNPTNVNVVLKGGSAIITNDFTYTTQTVTFPANSSTTQTFTFPIIDDVTQESDETIEFVLRNNTNSSTLATDSILTVTILANDVVDPVVSFVAPLTATVAEGADHILNIGITNPNATATNVKVYVKSVSTADGSDYTGVSTAGATYTFVSNSSANVSDTANVLNDIIAENGETIVLVLRDATNNATIGNDSIITITIPQNDQPLVAHFINTSGNVNENAGTAAVSVMAMGATTNGATSFDVLVKGGTASGSSDYTFTTQTVTIPGGKDSTVVFNIPIVNDNVFEIDETVIFTIRNITNAGVISTDSNYTLTIKNDDIQFKNISALRVNDVNGVSVLKDTSVYIKGIVYGVDMQGSATSLQYTLIDPTGGVGIFRAGASTPPIISLVPEEGDSVKVYGKVGEFNGLTQVNMDSIILISKANALRKPRVFTKLDESTESNLVVYKNAEILDTLANSASGTTLRISNGVDSIDLRIDADVSLFAQPITGRFDVIGLGGQFDASNPKNSGYQLLPRSINDIIPVVVIVPTVNIDSALYHTKEGAGTVTVKVSLSSAATEAGSVTFALTGGSAIFNSDFTFGNPGTLNFAVGATEATVTFTITDDAVVENNETINFAISDAVKCVLGTTTSSSIQIRDNDKLGLNNNKLVNFNVYPNPADQQVNIIANDAIQAISIVNIIGQTVVSLESLNTLKQTIDISTLSPGVYNIVLITENGSSTKRIVIK